MTVEHALLCERIHREPEIVLSPGNWSACGIFPAAGSDHFLDALEDNVSIMQIIGKPITVVAGESRHDVQLLLLGLLSGIAPMLLSAHLVNFVRANRPRFAIKNAQPPFFLFLSLCKIAAFRDFLALLMLRALLRLPIPSRQSRIPNYFTTSGAPLFDCH
jgi:hypothetical protein